MKNLLLSLALSLSLSFLSSPLASAQSSTPSPERTGVVTGQLANATEGARVPGDLPLMLHAWDASGETVMLDGVTDASGAFRFEGVPMQDGWVFGAMLGYEGVTYFSDTAEVGPDTEGLNLPLVVYETVADPSGVSVSRLHTFLDFESGEVVVAEVYVLSNPSDRSILGGLALPDGQSATLQFDLPPGANKVSFPADDSGGRYVLTPDGFADTGAVMPGEGTSEVIVTYTLPYQSGMAVAHPVGYPVQALNVLIPSGAGVAVTGNALGPPEATETGSGQVFDVYSAAGLAPGDPLSLTLSGEPDWASGEGEMSPTASPAQASAFERWSIPVGAGLLGTALVVLGVWWLRRPARDETEGMPSPDSADDWAGVVRAIAKLDEAHERGELTDEEHAERREALRDKARSMLRDETPAA